LSGCMGLKFYCFREKEENVVKIFFLVLTSKTLQNNKFF